ncbi:lantibiotic dehydratase [Myceligenerans indicum]|uniref:Lantibiotic dehydratase n=1 Tax=Myceligenerans indicum TaxID=2593663 RepID=A0ABS1LLK1_9MICO|nr:lantibiotic dehydratase [Myceligenerans indicum]MBL0886899.1 lantibiotic dehydratase [Myceligenerans indicum]
MIRTAALPVSDQSPVYPGPDARPTDTIDWLTTVWGHESFRRAVENASPDLAAAVAGTLAPGAAPDTRALRRIGLSVARYQLRATTRPSPFGLLAGVGPARFARATSISHQVPQVRIRPDALWLDDQIGRLEADPDVLRHCRVVADETIRRRADMLVLPHRTGIDGPAEARLRATDALVAILGNASAPVAVVHLLDAVGESYPEVPHSVVLKAVVGLVREGFLHTDVRPPSTIADPMGHLAAHRAPAVRAAAETEPDAVMTNWVTGMEATVSTRVARETERALAVMARISPHPHGAPAWREYHARFLETYSLGTLVPVPELVDPATGIGLPAGYRGADAAVAPAALTDRDAYLLALVQRAAAAGAREIVLRAADVDALSVAEPGQVPASTAMNVSVYSRSAAAIDKGDFRVVCGGLSLASGVTLGRFLPLLEPGERDERIAALAALPTLDESAVRVQISSPALRARTQNVTRSVQAASDVIAVGEHHQDATIRLADVAVGATTSRMFLVHVPTGRRIEPFVLNALEPVSATHPVVRFLYELPRAHAVVMAPFSWGAAAGLPFLPRVRTGKVVLSEARWRLDRNDIDRPDVAPPYALDVWLDRWDVPDRVFLGSYDQRLRLDLTEPGHRQLLLKDVTRQGRVTLTEAPDLAEYGWIGYANQLTMEFAATQAPAPAPEPLAGLVLARRGDARHPGSARTCLLKVYTPADLADVVLDGALRAELAREPRITDWWFTRYTDPDDHLRLRLRLHSPDDFGVVARHIAGWVAQARQEGLVRRILWDTDTPETGRYGTGAVLEAAEAFFMADSRAALAQLTRRRTVLPLSIFPQTRRSARGARA